MIPYHDENETRRTPIITFILIGLCVFTWLFVQGAMAPLAMPGPLTPVSEHVVAESNRDRSTSRLVAVYPDGGSPLLDFAVLGVVCGVFRSFLPVSPGVPAMGGIGAIPSSKVRR